MVYVVITEVANIFKKKKKKKNQKSQINGTILIKKNSIEKNPKNMNNKKKGRKKNFVLCYTFKGKSPHNFFLILILILKLSNVSEEVIVNHGIIRF